MWAIGLGRVWDMGFSFWEDFRGWGCDMTKKKNFN
jgi:hypothetical protein